MLFFLLLLFCYDYFVMSMSTTDRVNGTVQFTFFLVMKLNITIATSCDSPFSSLKLENGLKKYVQIFAEIRFMDLSN